jgi:hypothetical protein
MSEGNIEKVEKNMQTRLATEPELILELEKVAADGLNVSLESINEIVVSDEDFEAVKSFVIAYKQARETKNINSMRQIRRDLGNLFDKYF